MERNNVFKDVVFCVSILSSVLCLHNPGLSVQGLIRFYSAFYHKRSQMAYYECPYLPDSVAFMLMISVLSVPGSVFFCSKNGWHPVA